MRDIAEQPALPGNQRFNSLRHPIEVASRVSDLIPAALERWIDARVEASFGDVRRRLAQLVQRLRQIATDEVAEDSASHGEEQQIVKCQPDQRSVTDACMDENEHEDQRDGEKRSTLPLLAGSVGLGWATDITVGTATAQAGQKATGFIQVAAGVDAATNIPVIVINGFKPGPKLAIVAGSHGTEYASIIALENLVQMIDAADLSGTPIVVPPINPASFAQKVPHLNPVDGKNMNRMFPGKADGTQTERASWAIARQVVDKCDYPIDLHGGDPVENLRRYAY